MMGLIEELFPICRSITGNGLRRTLRVIQRYLPIEIQSRFPLGLRCSTGLCLWSGTSETPTSNAAMARGLRTSRRIICMWSSHSPPIKAIVSLAELEKHLHSLPEYPDWIPYRTSYYTENWGFCLPDRDLPLLSEGPFRVFINSELAPGHLSYGELLIPGQTDRTVLFSCHVCHPSLANDNLSGIAVATMLACHMQSVRPRYSYRFLFIPGTIGSITWLARNESAASRVCHGLVLSCLGNSGVMNYKQSRRGDAEIDRIVAHVLSQEGASHQIRPFVPYGYDERQVLLPRIRPSGRLPNKDPKRGVSRIPHLGGRSFVCTT